MPGLGMGSDMICPYCDGDGQLEYEIERPHNFNRDVGYIDTKWGECLECNGTGEIEGNDDED
jgi:RecJ-like exonuclease